jgi:hypothetical protein
VITAFSNRNCECRQEGDRSKRPWRARMYPMQVNL